MDSEWGEEGRKADSETIGGFSDMFFGFSKMWGVLRPVEFFNVEEVGGDFDLNSSTDMRKEFLSDVEYRRDGSSDRMNFRKFSIQRDTSESLFDSKM